MKQDSLKPKTLTTASLASVSGADDSIDPKGRYVARCFDAEGNLKWEDHYDNLVTDVGCKDMLDKYMAGSGYTAALYLGLISSVGFASAPVVTDTSLNHSGWAEAGGTNAPTYSGGVRATCGWAAATGSGAGSRTKALSSALSFTFTSAGTVKGSFVATVAGRDSTGGILFSAGLFSADRVVIANDILQVSYQLSM